MSFVDEIWECELLDAPDEEGNPIMNGVLYANDNTTKTKNIFEINKEIRKLMILMSSIKFQK